MANEYQDLIDKRRGELMSVTEVAQALGRSRWSVYRLIAADELAAIEWGVTGRKQKYVPRAEFERYTHLITKPVRAKRRRTA